MIVTLSRIKKDKFDDLVHLMLSEFEVTEELTFDEKVVEEYSEPIVIDGHTVEIDIDLDKYQAIIDEDSFGYVKNTKVGMLLHKDLKSDTVCVPRNIFYDYEVWAYLSLTCFKDIVKHLREKGWFDITAIAMDERPMRAMQQAMEVIRKADPEFKVALAGNYHPEIEAGLYDYCIALEQGELLPKEVLDRRKAEGKKTTVYTCCSTHKPNTFTFSVPAEAAWYGLNVA